MDPRTFVQRWEASAGRERANYQEHFINLCALLGEKTPGEADPTGDFYTFERGARSKGGDGYADVWYRHHFAWEYKGKNKHKTLESAYRQILKYREALENPPLLVVCDFDRYEVHTNWTNTESWIYRFRNEDIETSNPVDVHTLIETVPKDAPELTARQVLKALFENPDELKPGKTREQITEDAAARFHEISDEMRRYKIDGERVAKFITRLVFCMFASDVKLLKRETFTEVIRVNKGDPARFQQYLAQLFKAMRTGGDFLMHEVPYFNGRLFEDDDVPGPLDGRHLRLLEELDNLNWSDVEPAIFGTLFERVLDPHQRKALGAHYTSRDDIELIIEPVLMAPLRAQWRKVQADILEAVSPRSGRRVKAERQAEIVRKLAGGFLRELGALQVLDPACGSGNFLYVALTALKGLEKEVIALASLYGVMLKPRVHPRQLHGIEINEYAHELASVVIWIGYLQWKYKEGLSLTDERPILQPLDQIEGRDAVLDRRGRRPKEAQWPRADVIVGNPPYIGVRKMRRDLGDEYVEELASVYEGRVDRQSDYVCYWFEKARAEIEAGRAKRAGLLATQAIRGGANRKVLERIKETGDIFYAQADRKWILDGAAVRVSMVGFDDGSIVTKRLNEHPDDNAAGALERAVPVEGINANLTARADVTTARRLKENLGISFMGDTKVGPFEIEERIARHMLELPNPHGRPNSDVVRPWVNGIDITGRPRRMWIIDYRPGTSERDAAKYEAPFEYIRRKVRQFRSSARSLPPGYAWWIHGRPRPDMRAALSGLNRYLATPNLTKYRFFVWLKPEVLPDHQLIVFARSDDYFFGVLHSRVHEVWALRMGTQLESRPRYTPTTCFETFPLPHGSKDDQWAISLAAKDLNDLREGWLNPKVGSLGIAPKELRRRTLTNLYNERPTWLVDAHRALDEAVFRAYGWPEPPDRLSDAEIISRLLALNLQREPA